MCREGTPEGYVSVIRCTYFSAIILSLTGALREKSALPVHGRFQSISQGHHKFSSACRGDIRELHSPDSSRASLPLQQPLSLVASEPKRALRLLHRGARGCSEPARKVLVQNRVLLTPAQLHGTERSRPIPMALGTSARGILETTATDTAALSLLPILEDEILTKLLSRFSPFLFFPLLET